MNISRLNQTAGERAATKSGDIFLKIVCLSGLSGSGSSIVVVEVVATGELIDTFTSLANCNHIVPSCCRFGCFFSSYGPVIQLAA